MTHEFHPPGCCHFRPVITRVDELTGEEWHMENCSYKYKPGLCAYSRYVPICQYPGSRCMQ